jgi:transcriptional regulator with XRE-family HTH domain
MRSRENLEEYDYSALCGKIREKFKRQSDFAVAMGLSPSTLSKKLNNLSEWGHTEIVRACELLGLALEDAAAYFFVPLVVKSQLNEQA